MAVTPGSLRSRGRLSLFSCQGIDQIVGKFQILQSTMLLNKMGGAADPPLALQCSEYPADLLLQFFPGHNTDSGLDADAAQNGELVRILL